jgi:DNA-binding NtrC family response regulator
MLAAKTVITLGLEPTERLPAILAHLQNRGFDIVNLSTPGELLPTLDRVDDGIVVVFSRRGQNLAGQILRALHDRPTPVVVIADQCDFHEYYDLMCQGAYDYFDLVTDPRWIERSIVTAARQKEPCPA